MGQVLTAYEIGKENLIHVGSGAIVQFEISGKKETFMLSCSHNFVQRKAPKSINPKKKEFFYRQVERGTCLKDCIIDEVKVHEEYEKLGNCSEATGSGFDISVGTLSGSFDLISMGKNCFLSSIEKEEVSAGDKIIVSGYPFNANGKLYTSKGTILDIINTNQGGKLILYNNIQTTGGLSGSPVYAQTFNRKTGEREYRIIGIHVGFDPNVNARIATCIDEKMLKWIK